MDKDYRLNKAPIAGKVSVWIMNSEGNVVSDRFSDDCDGNGTRYG